jgi:hypothetical protein
MTVANFSKTTRPIDLKLKTLVFKSYQVTNTSQTQLQNNKNDFFKAIEDHLHQIKVLTLIVPDSPQVSNNASTSTNQINTIQNNKTNHIQTSNEDTFREETSAIDKLV